MTIVLDMIKPKPLNLFIKKLLLESYIFFRKLSQWVHIYFRFSLISSVERAHNFFETSGIFFTKRKKPQSKGKVCLSFSVSNEKFSA